ncbi:hypothetical protein CCOS2040_06765 [Streptomyces albidoflavus]|nr:hypothetical protein CCOS2040_06765 [Streptomyces albidoflavus]
MPATLVVPHPAPVSARPVFSAPVRLSRGGGSCPVCAERRCGDAGACATEYANRFWAECADCGGSGFDTLGFDIWCRVCVGARVLEV